VKSGAGLFPAVIQSSALAPLITRCWLQALSHRRFGRCASSSSPQSASVGGGSKVLTTCTLQRDVPDWVGQGAWGPAFPAEAIGTANSVRCLSLLPLGFAVCFACPGHSRGSDVSSSISRPGFSLSLAGFPRSPVWSPVAG